MNIKHGITSASRRVLKNRQREHCLWERLTRTAEAVYMSLGEHTIFASYASGVDLGSLLDGYVWRCFTGCMPTVSVWCRNVQIQPLASVPWCAANHAPSTDAFFSAQTHTIIPYLAVWLFHQCYLLPRNSAMRRYFGAGRRKIT